MLDRVPLTARQLAVLQWIADGCPDGIWPDDSHKISAGALETRNLATVRRWYGKWSAEVRADGAYYLEHGTYPGVPVSARLVRQPTVAARSAGEPARQTKAPAPKAPRVLRPAREPGPTERLIADIQAAGGSITLTPESDDERRSLEAMLSAAYRHNKVPKGMHLRVDRPTWKTYVLTIEALPNWTDRPRPEVSVPQQLRKPHAEIVRLRDADSLPIKGAAKHRALRLLQALITSVARRGHVVAEVRRKDRYVFQYARPAPAYEHVLFTVAGHEVGVRITQLQDRSDHVPTAKELAEKASYSWTRIPKYDYTPSDRLKIELTARGSGSWSDGVRKRLEDRLVEIIEAIEKAAVTAERVRLIAEEKRRQAQLEEEQRIARATAKLNEVNRARVFDEQSAAWFRSRHLAEYVSALEDVVAEIEDPSDGVAAGEWLAWVKRHVESLDPLKQMIAMPPDPAPTREALAPYLDRPRYGFMG